MTFWPDSGRNLLKKYNIILGSFSESVGKIIKK